VKVFWKVTKMNSSCFSILILETLEDAIKKEPAENWHMDVQTRYFRFFQNITVFLHQFFNCYILQWNQGRNFFIYFKTNTSDKRFFWFLWKKKWNILSEKFSPLKLFISKAKCQRIQNFLLDEKDTYFKNILFTCKDPKLLLKRYLVFFCHFRTSCR